MRQPCKHHWIISDDGRRGRCKYCGLVRIYKVMGDLSAGERHQLYIQAQLEVKAAGTAGK